MATDMTPKISEGRSIDSTRTSKEAMKRGSYHAKLILGSYRVGEANDPDIYVTAIAHVLSRYPADVGARLTDPKEGIAGKYKWLPSVSEVREEADKLLAADQAALRRTRDLQEQFRLREEQEQYDNQEPLEYRKAAAARILAEYKAAIQSPEMKRQRETWKRLSDEEIIAQY